MDGSTLYVDRNGDGDLTAPGERFTLGSGRPVDVGDITETDGKTVHRHLRMRRVEGQPDFLWVTVEIRGEYEMIAILRMDEVTDRPEAAPFRHFHGPLSFLPLGGEKAKLVRGEEPEDLNGALVLKRLLQGH